MAWQSSKQEQITHILCELWQDEEREIHVKIFDIFFIFKEILSGFSNRQRCDQ